MFIIYLQEKFKLKTHVRLKFNNGTNHDKEKKSKMFLLMNGKEFHPHYEFFMTRRKLSYLIIYRMQVSHALLFGKGM